MPYLGRRVGSLLFWDFVALFCMAEGHRDPRTHSVQGLFVRRGRCVCPLRCLCSHASLFPSPVFFIPFFLPKAFEACEPRWIADAREWNNRSTMILPPPRPNSFEFLWGEGENAVRFLRDGVSWNPSVCLAFFKRSLSC